MPLRNRPPRSHPLPSEQPSDPFVQMVTVAGFGVIGSGIAAWFVCAIISALKRHRAHKAGGNDCRIWWGCYIAIAAAIVSLLCVLVANKVYVDRRRNLMGDPQARIGLGTKSVVVVVCCSFMAAVIDAVCMQELIRVEVLSAIAFLAGVGDFFMIVMYFH